MTMGFPATHGALGNSLAEAKARLEEEGSWSCEVSWIEDVENGKRLAPEAAGLGTRPHRASP